MSLFFLYLGFLLFCLLGVLFGWMSLFRVDRLRQEVEALRRELRALHGAEEAAPRPETSRIEPTRPAPPRPAPARPAPPPPAPPPEKPAETPRWLVSLRLHWMVWLGGACVGLAGIFLVRHSVEQGLLGPGARVTAGILLGLGLHVAAETLRRRRAFHPSFAALAAGGSITLFAAVLAALHLYGLIGPGFAFTLLALVALLSMAMALLHGPVLAGLGVLGAYAVPLLVGGGAEAGPFLLAYVLVVGTAALLLMRWVYRDWLFGGVLAGSIGWLLLTLGEPGLDGLRGLYLAGFAYLLVAVPGADWLLNRRTAARAGLERYYEAGSEEEKLLPAGLLAIVLAQCLAILDAGFEPASALSWLPLAAVPLLGGARRPYLGVHAWLLLLAQSAAWIMTRLEDGADGIVLLPLPAQELTAFYWYCLAGTLLYAGLALLNYFRRGEDKLLWLSLAVLAPLVFLALSYMVTESLLVSPQWSLLAAALGASYLALAGLALSRNRGPGVAAWLTLGGHLGYSLAVAMALREASMTLALAAQVVSLAWILRRQELPVLPWLLKAVVAVVIVRLTVNPWLLSYPPDLHWPLWTYGGATLCCLAGWRLLRARPEAARWTLGASLHLFALTLWAESRYWLYDGNVYAGEFRFEEAVLNLCLFGALGLIYHWRRTTSALLAPLYRGYAAILLVFALLNYAAVLFATLTGLPWAWEAVGDRPVFNLLLPAFGAPVLLAALAWRWYEPRWRQLAALLGVFAAFVFVNLEIRHLWQGHIRLAPPPSSGELYSYSAVWLLLAILAILGGVWRFGEGAYRAGMLLLALAIAKLFLVDMADLQGLLRVASFLGMGVALLAVAYLHQRLIRARIDTEGEGAAA